MFRLGISTGFTWEISIEKHRMTIETGSEIDFILWYLFLNCSNWFRDWYYFIFVSEHASDTRVRIYVTLILFFAKLTPSKYQIHVLVELSYQCGTILAILKMEDCWQLVELIEARNAFTFKFRLARWKHSFFSYSPFASVGYALIVLACSANLRNKGECKNNA